MKFSSILFAAATAALCYLQGASASPISLEARATGPSTNKVIVG
jgi:hypothetical protein